MTGGLFTKQVTSEGNRLHWILFRVQPDFLDCYLEKENEHYITFSFQFTKPMHQYHLYLQEQE